MKKNVTLHSHVISRIWLCCFSKPTWHFINLGMRNWSPL